jgi:hypothetical protein
MLDLTGASITLRESQWKRRVRVNGSQPSKKPREFLRLFGFFLTLASGCDGQFHRLQHLIIGSELKFSESAPLDFNF